MNELTRILEFLVKANVEPALSELKRLDSALGAYKGKVSATNAGMGLYARNTNAASNATRNLHNNVKTTTAAKDRMRVATDGLRREIGRIRNEILVYSFALGGLASLLASSVKAHLQTQNAMTGLEAVAQKTVGQLDAVKLAAQGLVADGLMPIGDASASLKNLLSTNFTLEQSVNLLKAFKDAAAFGRQGALDYGEAIRGASEGLKNQNSILVDNVGIGKNLSVILREQGLSIDDLSKVTSDANVRLALYNGLLKEAAVFQGNAALLAQTLQGQLSKVSTEAFKLRDAIGSSLAVVIKDVSKDILSSVKAWREYINANREVLALQIGEMFRRLSELIGFFLSSIMQLVTVFGLVPAIFNRVTKETNELNKAFEAFLSVLTFLITKKLLAELINLLGKIPAVAALGAGALGGVATVLAVLTGVLLPSFLKWIDSSSRAQEEHALKTKLANAAMIDHKNRIIDLIGEQQVLINGRINSIEALKNEGKATRDQIRELESLREQMRFLNKEAMDAKKSVLTLRLGEAAGELAGSKLARDILPSQLIPSNFAQASKQELDTLVQMAYKRIPVIVAEITKTVDALVVAEKSLAQDKFSNMFTSPDTKTVDTLKKRKEDYESILESLHKFVGLLTQLMSIEDQKPLVKTTKQVKELDKEMIKLTESVKDFLQKTEFDLIEQEFGKFNRQRAELVSDFGEMYDILNKAKASGVNFEQTFGMSEEQLRRALEFAEAMKMVGIANAEAIEAEEERLKAAKKAAEQLAELQRKALDIFDMIDKGVGGFQNIGKALFQPFVLKDEANAQIDELRKQLNRGEITHQEFAARVRNIHKNLGTQISNVWRGVLGNFIANSTQILQELVVKALATKSILQASLLGGAIGIVGGFLASLAGQPAREESFDFTEQQAAEANRRERFGGMAAAPTMNISITPTVSITGQNVWVGGGTIQELETGLEVLITDTIKKSLEVGELDFTGLGRDTAS